MLAFYLNESKSSLPLNEIYAVSTDEVTLGLGIGTS